jgi:hypothetical protein
MPRTLQFKRYGSATLANTIGANGELIINQTNKTLTVHDGITPGGFVVSANTIPNADSFARGTANSATTLAQSAYNYANTLPTTSVDSFARNTANGSATSAQTAHNTANSATTLAQSAYNYANTLPTTSIDSFARNTANSATTLAQSAFDAANTNNQYTSNNINVLQGINLTQNTNINNVINLAQSAFNAANTGGTGVFSANTLLDNLNANNYSINNVDNLVADFVSSNVESSKVFNTALSDPSFGYTLDDNISISAQKTTSNFAIGTTGNWLKFGGKVGTFDSKKIVIAPDESNGWTMSLGGTTVNQVGFIPPGPTFISAGYISDVFSSNVRVDKISSYNPTDLIINGGEFAVTSNIILGNNNTTMVKVGNATNVDLSVTGNISSLGVSANTITANNLIVTGNVTGLISITQLKTLAANAATYADFQTAIASL